MSQNTSKSIVHDLPVNKEAYYLKTCAKARLKISSHLKVMVGALWKTSYTMFMIEVRLEMQMLCLIAIPRFEGIWSNDQFKV